MTPSLTPNRLRTWPRLVVAALALTGATAALAQGRIDRPAIESQYRADRQLCTSGGSPQPMDSCLWEARLVREAMLAGGIGGEDPDVLARNALRRCGQLPSDDEDECRRLMRGAGDWDGSVREGAIVRMLVTEEPAETTASAEQAPGQPGQDGATAPAASPRP